MTTVMDKFWHLKDELHDMMVTATIRKDVEVSRGEPKVITAGTKVRVVMMSRFGDVGITPHLDQTGYLVRIGSWEGDEPNELEEWFEDIQGMDESDLIDICFSYHNGYVDVVRNERDNTWSVLKDCERIQEGIVDREVAREIAERLVNREYTCWFPCKEK